MSQRSLVELNHDFCPQMDNTKLLAWAHAMRTYMGSGDPADLPYGVVLKWRRHHSAAEPTAADITGRRAAMLARIIAPMLADGRCAGPDGIPRVGRATRAKAVTIAAAIVNSEVTEVCDAG